MKAALNSILIFAFVLTSAAQAQFLRGYGFKIGVVAANQSWVSTHMTDLATENRWGLTGSAFVELLSMPYLSLLVEAQYTQKGMTLSAPVGTAQYSDGTGQFIVKRPRVDYLSLPLLAKLRFGMPLITSYLIAGPRYDLLLSKHGEGFDAVINDFKSSELGATIGVGVELESVLPINTLIEFRYNANLEDAFNTELWKVRNHTLDLMLGVRL